MISEKPGIQHRDFMDQALLPEDISKLTYPMGTNLKISSGKGLCTDEDGKVIRRTRYCTVVGDYEHYILCRFDTEKGSYLESINKVDIAVHDVEVEVA